MIWILLADCNATKLRLGGGSNDRHAVDFRSSIIFQITQLRQIALLALFVSWARRWAYKIIDSRQMVETFTVTQKLKLGTIIACRTSSPKS